MSDAVTVWSLHALRVPNDANPAAKLRFRIAVSNCGFKIAVSNQIYGSQLRFTASKLSCVAVSGSETQVRRSDAVSTVGCYTRNYGIV